MTLHAELATVRPAEESEVERLAEIWYEGWQDAHAAILPAELARVRTKESFKDRLRAGLKTVRVVGSRGEFAGPTFLNCRRVTHTTRSA